MIGDLPEADAKPPEDMLFVCKLNQVRCAGVDECRCCDSRSERTLELSSSTAVYGLTLQLQDDRQLCSVP